MADITNLGPLRHLRADTISHILQFQGARLRRSGRGLTFWFAPWSTSIAEVPVDDRELSLAFHGRSADFQDVVVQGVLTYRITNPTLVTDRIDFSIDLRSGAWLKQPLEKLALILAQLAQQHTLGYLQTASLRDILAQAHERIRAIIETNLRPAPLLAEMGVELVSVRVSSLKPSTDLERALEAPERERIQQNADEATFRRRALAVEKERAIQENELQNQIELARREQQLIEQRGQNAGRDATLRAEAARIDAESNARSARVQAEASADGIKAIDGARLTLDMARLDAYRTMPPALVAALAVQELAGKLQKIEHLNLTPDLLGPMLAGLVGAGTRHLDAERGK
jgi:regulator of protease activity HflC (stomatin/prohibitin superfamily)